MEENVSMDTADTSGIDVIEGAAVTGCESAAVGEEPGCGETAAMEPVPADDGADGEEETGQKASVPFWGKKRIGIACGIAAALVVGAVGVGALAMGPADAGTAAPKAEQKADPAGKLAGTSGTKADAAKGAPSATAGASSGDAAAEAGAEGADGAQDAAAAGDEAAAEAAAGAPVDASASSAPEDKAAPSSGSSSKPAASAPKKEEHKHSWEPVYEKKWVENWVTVQAAWDEEIPGKDSFVCSCGETFQTQSAVSSHIEDMLVNHSESHSYNVKSEKPTIKHHDAIKEDQGHYEKVKTGEKCSGCGQTR